MYYQFYHNNVETVTNGSTAADKIKIKTLKVFYYLNATTAEVLDFNF